MSRTITITVSIVPVSSRDSSGGTVRVRVPLIDPDSGDPRTETELHQAATARAVEKLYGRGCFWWADSGLPGYGQVMHPSRLGGSDAVTYRAKLDVEIPLLPETHRAALEQRAAAWEDETARMARDRAAGYGHYPAPRPKNSTWEFDQGWDEARENAQKMREWRAGEDEQ